MTGFDNVYLLAWESLYQVLTVMLLFWTDIIPGFGTSTSIEQWATRLGDGLTCFFAPWNTNVDHCDFCFLTGSLFTMAYCFSYIFGSQLMKYGSANATAIVSSVSPAFIAFFWIIFSGLNKWAGGKPSTSLEIICYIISVPLIITGIILYRKSEKEQIKKEACGISTDDEATNYSSDKLMP